MRILAAGGYELEEFKQSNNASPLLTRSVFFG
jgi:hypothetical protein